MNWSSLQFDALSLFLAWWIILSVWAGYTIGISIWIPIIALGMVYLIVSRKKLDENQSSFQDASPILVGGVFLALLAILFIQGGHDLSADVAPSFAASLIQNKIPFTYQPFFDLPLFYPLGMPSIVSQLAWTGMPFHQWSWILGALGMALIVFYSSRWARLLNIPNGKYLIPVLIIGLRFPLISQLSGEYPLLLGYGVGMAAVWLGREQKEWFVLGAVAATLLHPYAGLIAWLGGLIILKWKINQLIIGIIATAVGIFPMLLYQFLPLLQQSGEPTLIVAPILPNLSALASVVGIVPVFAGLLGTLGMIIARKMDVKKNWKVWLLLGLGLCGVLAAFVFPTSVFAGKIVLFLGLGFVFLTGLFFSPIKKSFSEIKIAGIILIIILFITFSSNAISHLVNGSKISHDEANYSTWLAQHYPVSHKKVLFLSHGHTKMAQFAGTIPYDAISSHFLTSVTYSIFSTPETIRIKEEAQAFKELLASRCAECAEQTPADYIVVNTREFPRLKLLELNETNGFVLYQPID